MRVGQLGRDVEAKVLVIGDNCVAQLEHQAAGLAESLAEQDGLKGRVQLSGHVLKQAGFTKADCVLKRAKEVPVGELDNVQAVFFLQALCPLVALALGVDEERPALRVLHDDAVLDGEGVFGQACQLPLADFHGVAQGAHDLRGLGVWHVEVGKVADPDLGHLVAVLAGKGAQVGDEAGRAEHVADHVRDQVLEVFDVLCPADFLVAQAGNQLKNREAN